MTPLQQEKKKLRSARLLPNGIPRYIRCYDSGENGSFDRYTVCYTGNYRGKTDWFQYVGMSTYPFHPQGFGQHGESETQIDRPTYGHLGKKIKFEDLPQDCQKLVLQDYKEIWKL